MFFILIGILRFASYIIDYKFPEIEFNEK